MLGLQVTFPANSRRSHPGQTPHTSNSAVPVRCISGALLTHTIVLPPALNVPTETGRQVRACGEGHYKPRWLRLAGVAAVIITTSALGAVNYTEAGAYLAHNLPHYNKLFPNAQASLSEAPSIFTKRWYETFKETQGVDDAPRAGRPHKIPDKSAKQAAEGILAQGYNVTYTLRGRQVEELKHFSTMSEAVGASETLRNMLAEFEATPEQMLEAIHRLAPELKHRRVTFRHSLSAAEGRSGNVCVATCWQGTKWTPGFWTGWCSLMRPRFKHMVSNMITFRCG